MLETAIVGLGNVATWHRRGIRRTSGATLTAIADATVAGERATEWGVTSYTDVAELLAAVSPEWGHVCTPVASHADIAVQCLDAGAHVLVEKPMAATREEYETLVERADDLGLRSAGYPAGEQAVDIQRINTIGDEDVAYDGIAISYRTAAEVACTIQHHSNVFGSRQVEYFLEGGRVVADIPTQTVSVYPEGYGPNTTVDRAMLNAAYWQPRNAASAVRSAASIRIRQPLANVRNRKFTVHDTHTPVIRREAGAIRGRRDGPTPRAEAN